MDLAEKYLIDDVFKYYDKDYFTKTTRMDRKKGIKEARKEFYEKYLTDKHKNPYLLNIKDSNNKTIVTNLGEGVPVGLTSERLELFYTKGTTCACCGLKATHFRKTMNAVNKKHGEFQLNIDGKEYNKNAHLNLFGVRNGQEVLFTKDHIKARSNGGSNSQENYQPMCHECNEYKGSRDISLAELQKELKRREYK